MSIGFDKLKSIGAQKIHEVTHIARAHVKSILEENFEDMNSVQLSGFISILEREYSVDLSDLKQRAKEHFQNSKSATKKEKTTHVFLAHKKKKNLTNIYIGVGVVLVVLFLLFTATPSQEEAPKVDDITIESAKSGLPLVVVEENETLTDANATSDFNATPAETAIEAQPQVLEVVQAVAQATETEKAPAVAPIETAPVPAEAPALETPLKDISFKIMPNTKVWFGYIDVAEQKKYQTTFSKELSLDPAKEWLLAFGHGFITIEINGVTTKFTTPRNIRFLYKNSELKEISVEEFKSLNNGNIW